MRGNPAVARLPLAIKVGQLQQLLDYKEPLL
jgi:hypothetical protein